MGGSERRGKAVLDAWKFANWWRVEPLAGLVLGIAIAAVVGAFFLWLELIRPPPGQAINVPHQWTCHSKSYGGYCERTGGLDRKGRPWGTEVPKGYRGPPTQEDSSQMAMSSGR